MNSAVMALCMKWLLNLEIFGVKKSHPDRYGKECSFQDYLKSNGIFSSKLHLYLLTCPKQNSSGVNPFCQLQIPNNTPAIEDRDSFELMRMKDSNNNNTSTTVNEESTFVLVIDGHIIEDPGKISIRYTKDTFDTSQNEIRARVNCYSHDHCEEVCFDPDCTMEYDPFDDGFYVSSVMKDGKSFLELLVDEEDESYHFPEWKKEIDSSTVILHGPNTIYGYEGDKLLLGVISSQHASSHEYVWLKDGNIYKQGKNRAVLRVTTEGMYTGGIWIGETMYVGGSVQVFRSGQAIPTAHGENQPNVCGSALVPERQSTPLVSRVNEEGQRMEPNFPIETVESSFSVAPCNFNDLNIMEEIGKGAFGVVYKAEWLGAVVAVKALQVKRMKVAKSKIEREILVHSKIRHPRIVQLVTFCTNADKLYLVSEMINGPNLDAALFGCEFDGLIEQKHKKQIAKEIVSAVVYLHNLDILHRDIKPENVVIEKATLSSKLCDLGVSKVQSVSAATTTTVGAGAEQPGTPAYQAPEILLEKKSASKCSDVWSLACTIFELYSEFQIWDTDDCDTIKDQMKIKLLPSGLLKNGKNALPEPLFSIISKAFQYKPEERPTAVDFLEVLQNLKD